MREVGGGGWSECKQRGAGGRVKVGEGRTREGLLCPLLLFIIFVFFF